MTLSRWNKQPGEHREKVAILACDPSHRVAPFEHDEWLIWGCNSMWQICRDSQGDFRADAWFEMHPMSVQTAEELEAIRRCPVPIYHLGDATPEQAPLGVAYPFQAVVAQFPYQYFTCTFAYQIALALHRGFTTIGLFGVELDQGTARERMVEKACVEFWLGLALGAGVKVVVPDTSRLCTQGKLYGYQYQEEVDEVNGILDGLFFRRVQELEQVGIAERISSTGYWREGNA